MFHSSPTRRCFDFARCLRTSRPSPRRARWLLGCFLAGSLTACGESAQDRRDAGYADGYAVGYNTTCQIRETMIHGDWGDAKYSEGYAAGMVEGISACNRDRGQIADDETFEY